nr:S24 family peptidase [Nocardioides aurantiacus]
MACDTTPGGVRRPWRYPRGSELNHRTPRPWGMALVRGRSMEPTLRDGDRLLVRYAGPARAGDVAVVRFADGVVAVKRLDHHGADGWWVARDNPVEGRDSWSAGAVADVDVLARVVGRLWPRPGRLGGPPER